MAVEVVEVGMMVEAAEVVTINNSEINEIRKKHLGKLIAFFRYGSNINTYMFDDEDLCPACNKSHGNIEFQAYEDQSFYVICPNTNEKVYMIYK